MRNILIATFFGVFISSAGVFASPSLDGWADLEESDLFNNPEPLSRIQECIASSVVVNEEARSEAICRKLYAGIARLKNENRSRMKVDVKGDFNCDGITDTAKMMKKPQLKKFATFIILGDDKNISPDIQEFYLLNPLDRGLEVIQKIDIINNCQEQFKKCKKAELMWGFNCSKELESCNDRVNKLENSQCDMLRSYSMPSIVINRKTGDFSQQDDAIDVVRYWNGQQFKDVFIEDYLKKK